MPRENDIQHLWRDTDEFREQRAKDYELFKQIYHHVPKKEFQLYENFFWKGEWESYIPGATVYKLIPINSSQDWNDFIGSKRLDSTERGMLFSFSQWFEWERKKQDFPNRLLKQSLLYTTLKETFLAKSEDAQPACELVRRVLSPYDFIKFYLYEVFREKRLKSSIMEDLLPVFIKALGEVDSPRKRKKVDLNGLFEKAEGVIDNPQEEGHWQELAKQLLESKAVIYERWLINE